MANLLEGEWKKYTFRIIEKADYPIVIKHLKENFHQDEPLSAIVGTSELKNKDEESFTIEALHDGLSIAAFETETGKLAGARVTCRRGKNQKQNLECESEEQATIFAFLDSAQSGIDIFERYGLDEYAELLMASVDREFRRDGLATELYERTLKLLRHVGLKLAKSTFTSPYTRKISEKYGFEELAVKYFRELQNTRSEYICPDASEDQYVALKVLRL